MWSMPNDKTIQTNKIKSTKTLLLLLIIPTIIMFHFIIPIILCIQHYPIPIQIPPKEIRLNITNNRRQPDCSLDHIKPFRRVNNREVTWNRAINEVQNFLRQIIQSPITNRTLHYVTSDEAQSNWINKAVLKFDGINIFPPLLQYALAPKLHLYCDLLFALNHWARKVGRFNIYDKREVDFTSWCEYSTSSISASATTVLILIYTGPLSSYLS